MKLFTITCKFPDGEAIKSVPMGHSQANRLYNDLSHKYTDKTIVSMEEHTPAITTAWSAVDILAREG